MCHLLLSPWPHAGGIRGKSLVMHWHVCLDDSHKQLPAVMQLVTNWNPGNPGLFQIGQDFCPILWETSGPKITLLQS